MKKKLLTVTLAAMMTVLLLPTGVWAKTDANQGGKAAGGDTIAQIAAQLQDSTNDPFDYPSAKDKKKAMKAAASQYPTSFDLRNVNGTSYVTPVKFQNPFGTCWGFAAIAAAESSILGSGLAAGDGYDANTLDLSEKHLVYFVSQAISDKDDPQYGEGTHADADVTVADLLNGGGMPFMATSLFASGMGPNLENRDPILQYKGANGWTMKRTRNGKVQDLCYSDEDDWSLPEDWRFRQSYVLKESYMLPDPAVVDEETGEYTYNQAGTDAIKEMLVNKRAVQIGFCADTSTPSLENGDGKYISKNWAHYTYDAEERANHAVTVVGWDDDYPATNFVEGHEPKDADGNLLNGAWLVKNSWGSEERDFPNRSDWGVEMNGKHTGYFWLSYYDKTISMAEALAFDKSNVQKTYMLDEHDFMPVNEVSGAAVENETKMANVFQAEECEKLEQVSCETTYPGTTVVSEVYILPDDFSDPTDGLLVDRTEATFDYGGFHKMNLTTPQIIQKGQYYAIVQTQKTSDGQYAFNVPFAYNKEFMKWMYESESWVEGVINERESYMYTDGTWHDYAGDAIKQELFGPMSAILTFDNFPIKGYCTPADNLNIRVSGNLHLDRDGEDTLVVYYTGEPSADFDAPKVSWQLAEGGDRFFELTQDSDRPHVATVKAKDVGQARLFISVDGIGTKAVTLSVARLTIGGMGFSRGYIYNGKKHTPKPEVEDADGNLIPSSHYTLSYKNNKKCGDAEVTVKIKSGDTRYEGEFSGLFSIYPRKAVVKSMTAGKGRLTLKVKDGKSAGVTHYQVKYRVKGTSKWKTKKVKVASGSKLTLKGLGSGKRYQIKVSALAVSDMGSLQGDYSKTRVSPAVR